MTALIVSAFLAVTLTVVLLGAKAKVERTFNRRRKIPLLHAANVLIVAGAMAASYYMLSQPPSSPKPSFVYMYLGAVQLLLPIYAFISVLFAQNEKKEKKYTRSDDRKVLYIKEEYLAGKRQDRHYHSKTS